MNNDGIPNATGDVWEYVSNGPDHSKIRAAYDQDPTAWYVQWNAVGNSDIGWLGVHVSGPAWNKTYCYRMRRRFIATEQADYVNRPSHYTQGDIECIDAMTSAFGEPAVKQWAHMNAFKYLWRADHKGGEEDRRKAIWYLRYSNGDDPRKAKA